MALTGNLEDISFVDVLQLIHLSQKNGNLTIKSGDESASILFLYGKIIAASTTTLKSYMSDKLVEKNILSEDNVKKFVVLQNEMTEKKPLGSILLKANAVKFEELQQALKEYIQDVINELVSWNSGEFAFDVNDIDAHDEISFFPKEISNQIDYDTQSFIMESLRVLDERNKKEQEKAQLGKTPLPDESLPMADENDINEAVDHIFEAEFEINQKHVILFNTNGFIRHTIKDICSQDDIIIYNPASMAEVHEWIKHCLLDGVTPLLVMDAEIETEKLNEKMNGIEFAKHLKADFPEIPLIMFGETELFSMCLKLGARAFIPKPTRKEEHKEYVKNMDIFLERLRSAFIGHFYQKDMQEEGRMFFSSQIKKLRNKIDNLRKHEQSSTVSLELLRYIADYYERGIIFLIKEDYMMALGAFGNNLESAPLHSLLTKLHFNLDENPLFKQIAEKHQAFNGVVDEEIDISPKFFEIIGAPTLNEVLVLPMVVNQKVAAIIYADMNNKSDKRVEPDYIQILAMHAGIILEKMWLKKERLNP